nr:E3 ubiquitin-protein ligase RHF2A-like [Ipomoea batatas]
MEEGKVSENQLTSAAAFVEGGIQDACDDACSICLEAFSDSDPSTVTVCKHEFHLQCILEWDEKCNANENLGTKSHIGIPPTGEHDSRTLAVTTIAAPMPVQHHPPPTLEVTTVGSAPSSSGLALSPRTSHLALAPSSPVFANQSPVGLAAPNSSMAVDLKEPSRSERVSPLVEAACSEETVEAVRSVHATGSMPAPST